jgi:hypothetical protein
MMEVIRSSETSDLIRVILHHIPEEGILHSHSHENQKSYMSLIRRVLYRRSNVFPVRYELGFYIPEDGIRYSHRRENPKSYILNFYCKLIKQGAWISLDLFHTRHDSALPVGQVVRLVLMLGAAKGGHTA